MSAGQALADPGMGEAEAHSPRGARLDRAALRVVFLSSLGGALEFYDFIIFGTFAAYISRAFFPAADPLVSLLQAYAGFAIGYLVRPLGGLLFGARGDNRGRRDSFLLSLATMSAATIAMGLMPTYAEIGIAAPLLFLGLRCVQGFCLGGELPGAITYAVEIVPLRRASLACGIVFACVSTGVVVATGVNAALSTLLTPAQMDGWGWRIAFLLGGAFGVISWMLRRSLEETPAFLRMTARLEAGRAAAGPLRALFRDHGARIVAGIFATCIVAAFNGLLFGFLPGFLGQLGYPRPEIGQALWVSSLANALSLLAFTWLADIVPRRFIFRTGCVLLTVLPILAFGALVDKSMPLPTLAILIGLAGGFTHGTFASILADLFPARVRFSGVAFAMNIGAVIFSALGPILATLLIKWTGRLDSPGWIVAGSAVLALGASFALPRLSGHLAADEAETAGTPQAV